jgi:hypothetical protein
MRKLLILAMLPAILLYASCAGHQPPTSPANQDNNGSTYTIDGSHGAQISYGLLHLDFPPDQSLGEFTLQITQATAETGVGIVSLSEPYRIVLNGLPGNTFPEGYLYKVWFDMKDLTGSQQPSHEYYDIQRSTVDSAGKQAATYSWAKIDENGLLYCPSSRINEVLVPIDYSDIPGLSAPVTFTDDPNVAAEVSREACDAYFNPLNAGPLGTRIPVILIHGLCAAQTPPDPELEDSFASWDQMVNCLNSVPWIYSTFKFYWFIYPSSQFVAGYGNGGVLLKNEIQDWAATHDPGILQKQLVLVGASLGGIMARDYYQNFNNPPVYKLITIGTPNYGTPLVNVCLQRWTVGDLQDMLWLKTPGSEGMRSKEAITYNWGSQVCTTPAYPYAPIANLNAGLTTGQLSKIIMLGGAYTVAPTPADNVIYSCNWVLTSVTSPTYLKEYESGIHSDTIVPWRSQLYQKTAYPPPNTLFDSYHGDLLSNPGLLSRLYYIFVDIWTNYPRTP